jgi:2'-5' RNA ligase
MRLFLALILEEGSKKRLFEIEKQVLKCLVSKHNPEKMEKLHLTLKFFGEASLIEEGRIVEKLMDLQGKKFFLNFVSVGQFNNRVVYLKPKEVPLELQEIMKKLREKNLLEENFKAHLTIARMKEPLTEKEKFCLERQSFKEKIPIKRIALMESFLSPKGSVYKEKFIRELI